ncbi:hypothetical protein C8R44DRAFT_870894 [Mycena epipterygia]|nr:hypothetical protein C8R44DRAFT_870894 [Mycena epipterygia]
MAVVAANAILLIASWFNAGLYMLEIFLAAWYFQSPGRPLWQKLGVATFVITDTANTVGICAQVYNSILLFPCLDTQNAFLDALIWPIAVNILATYGTASVEQGFMCYLFYVLLGSVFCATTDVLLAAGLGLTFYKLGEACYPGRATQTFVRRLLFFSVTSGAMVASITLIAMILELTGSPVYAVFFFIQGRAYGLTVLSHFLFGLPVHNPTPESRRTGISTGTVVFHLDYRTSSDATTYGQTSRPESLNLQALPELHVKTQPDK